jgi:hypothetical protein
LTCSVSLRPLHRDHGDGRALAPFPRPDGVRAALLAAERVDAVADSPAGRLHLAADFYRRCRTRARYGRAEMSFLRWEIVRGVLGPMAASRPGSRWWRAVNTRLLRDKIEADLLAAAGRGHPSSRSVELWLGFLSAPSPLTWYRAHNASIAGGYLEHEALARHELPAERFVINVALARVLFTHAMLARPRVALGRFAAAGPRLADPRRGAVDLFLDLRRPFPEDYPLRGISVADLVAREGRLPRAIDDAVILPRIAAVYAFAAEALEEPRIGGLLHDGAPCYAMGPDQRGAWPVTNPRLLRRRRRTSASRAS